MRIAVELVNVCIYALMYAPAIWLVFRRLWPRLSRSAQVMAALLLLAQAAVHLMALAVPAAERYAAWLWQLDLERNIAGVLSSTQLALIAAVALAAAWSRRQRPRRDWLYFLSVSLALLLFALAENSDYFKTLAAAILPWRVSYGVIGISLAWLTVFVAQGASNGARPWHKCFLAGLLLAGAGGLALDSFGAQCLNPALFPLEGCLRIGYFEEVVESLGAWLMLVALLGHFSADATAPSAAVRKLIWAAPPLWAALAVVVLPLPPLTHKTMFGPGYQLAELRYESGVALRAFDFDIDFNERSITFNLLLSPPALDFSGEGYSIRLIDQVSGASVAGSDQDLTTRRELRIGPGYVPVARQWTKIELPPDAPTNRALWLVLSHWREQNGGYVRQRIVASELHLLDETQVVLGEFVLPQPQARSVPLAAFDNGFALESVDLPANAKTGAPLDITFSWRSAVADQPDFVQFLHFVQADGDAIWAHDRRPLGDRLPTRLWYSGLADSETWPVPLPPDLTPGRYNIFTGLYRVRDQERLPVSDSAGNPFIDGRVPLGSLLVAG